MRFFFVATDETKNEYSKLIAGIDEMGKPPTQEQAYKVSKAMRDQFRKAFEGEGQIQGAKWPQLAESTVKERIRLGYEGRHPILVRSGEYMASWTGDVRGMSFHVSQLVTTSTGWQLVEGSKHPYAIWHEKGTARMPARPVRFINRQDIGVRAAVKRVYDAKWPAKNKVVSSG